MTKQEYLDLLDKDIEHARKEERDARRSGDEWEKHQTAGYLSALNYCRSWATKLDG